MIDPSRSLEAGYAQIVTFEAQPEIAAATFEVDSDNPQLSGADITTVKLPLYREFGEPGERRLFFQLTGSYLEIEETLRPEFAPGFSSRLDASWTGYGALLEGGVVLPLSDHFSLAPSIGVGVTRLESEMDFRDPLVEDLLAPVADGVLYNWDTLASVARASVSLRYDRRYERWRFKGNAHLSGSYIDSFDESRRFPGFSDQAGNIGVKFDAARRLDYEIRDNAVHLIGHLGYTSLIGANRDALGFSSFGEAGMSVGVQKFTFGLLGIFGSDVSGLTLQFNYDY